ncbi:MAG: biotin--[acetyl-CoA-carboxylase] ligase [Calditrichaeota bacterium]|nr:biotin--[acetyl-CoA-carboxylase] ligase [Calditrichota bacterium]MCB9391174.1 biotin--[acetyl-CoA-carboxylase] ligase [Calditrichota bacterium]
MSWNGKQFYWHLTTRRFGREFRFLEETDSTNRWLRDNISEFHLSGSVVVAGHQTSGRGRYSRVWDDRANQALLCSVLLKLKGLPERPGLLSMLPAIALARVVVGHDSTAAVRLKWPNDVLIGGKKVAGVLAEATKHGDDHVIIVGVGVNVNGVPETAGQKSTVPGSLLQETSWKADRESVLAALLNEWEELFDMYLEGEYEALRMAWEEHGPDRGAVLVRSEGNERIEGEYCGIGSNGQLLLRDASGVLRETYSGDVTVGL